MSRNVTLLLCLSSCFLMLAQAELRLASVFTDHMVLQRDLPAPVWGTDTPGSQITVIFGDKRKQTTTDKDGRWEVTLHGLRANKDGQTLNASSSSGQSISLQDILVGEVWLASGQTNMEWKISASQSSEKKTAKSATFPNIRLLKVARNTSYEPSLSFKGVWKVSTPDHSKHFSAVAWHFAHQLNLKLDIPIGIIQSSWGGSRIEPWINEQGMQSVPALKKLHQSRRARTPGTSEYKQAGKAYLKQLTKYTQLYAEHLQTSSPAPDPPVTPSILSLGNQEIGVYPAMIQPLTPFSLRGFLWYQGESNIQDGPSYFNKKQALVAGWREAFRRPNAPFYFVQLAPFRYNTSPTRLPEFWATQQKCLQIPNTGMVVTNDLGNLKNINPNNKYEIGKRLALLALNKNYAIKSIANSPLYKSHQIKDNAIIINFQKNQKLRSLNNKDLSHFEISSENGTFHAAHADILPDQSIKLTSKAVPRPTKARFAWHQTAQPNLVNQSGLPAAAFHTHWPADSHKKTPVSLHKTYVSSAPNIKGWSKGLTDGSWSEQTKNCFATNDKNSFPKSVTIDLEKVHSVTSVKFGLPSFGSTKTVQVELSKDGKEFKPMGHHSFPLKARHRSYLLRCNPTPARFVKLIFPDYHQKEISFSKYYSFLTEAEVYAN